MKRPRALRSAFVLFVVLAGLIITLASHPLATSSQDAANSRNNTDKNNDVAHWKIGELVAPLPADPARRAEAIRAAKEAGRARAAARGVPAAAGVVIAEGVAQPEPVGARRSSGIESRSRRASAPPFATPLPMPDEPFQPTVEELRKMAEMPVDVFDPAQTPAAPGRMGYFDAIDFTGWTPASPDIAAGPEHILAATTDVFAVYDKCGQWIDGGIFSDYFGISSAYTVYDPRVVYDDWHGRWLMAYIANDFTNDLSKIVVAVSETADLRDGWACWYVVGFPTAGSFADNMYMAVDPEAIYFTFNEYNFVSYAFEGAKIVAFDKLDVYACQGASYRSFTGLTNPGDATDAFAVRPAQMHSYPGEMYFFNTKSGGGTIATVWWIEDPLGTPTVGSQSVTMGTYALPPVMRQPNGSYVNGGDCRVADLVYDGGYLYTTFSIYFNQAGNDLSAAKVSKIGVSPVAYSTGTAFVVYNCYVSYPSLDVDEYGRVGLTYTYCSNLITSYLSTYYRVTDFESDVDGGLLAMGSANFTLGGSGTISNPYRWGNYTGCAIDPVDNRTFWIIGARADDDPTPSWQTRVYAVSGFAESDLEIDPSSSVTAGVPGGPFVNELLPVTLSNTGETDLHWQIDSHPEWLTPSATSGQIPPAGSQVLSFFVNEAARELPVGEYIQLVPFTNCTGDVSSACWMNLTIVEPVSCATAAIPLNPDITNGLLMYSDDEWSLYVTALEDIDVCAIGMTLADPEPLEITCSVYEADGTTRGPLVHFNSQVAVEDVEGTYLVPMDVSLSACEDYEIVFTHPATIGHSSYDETEFTYPFDANGLIRVTQSAKNGVPSNTQHPSITVFGRAACDELLGHNSDLQPFGTAYTLSTTNSSVGMFVTARENLYLCSVDFEADLVRGDWLVARLYEASGNTRGAMVAEGFLPVETGGRVEHEVPIHALVEAGQDYNISLYISETGYWPAVSEAGITMPYDVDGIFDVRKSESGGTASTSLPHIRLNWDEIAVRGVPFDLAKSSDGIPPPYSGSGALDYGAFVEPSAEQEIYSLGVYADIHEGTFVVARIYEVTPGGARAALLTEGMLQSGGSGPRWHDVPVALTWLPSHRYDLSIVCSNSTEYRYWTDKTGMPYTPYGTIEVQDAESGGDPGGTTLIHLRVNACDDVMTAIGDRPPVFTPFSLEAPVPNPVNGVVRFHYSIDVPGAVDLEIYDVAGRRVATVFKGRSVDVGPGTAGYDTSGLASGVYFLKLTCGGKAVTRKIVVTR
ncbi:MAG: T9SS type A sorting domain-containing protein [bacterium]